MAVGMSPAGNALGLGDQGQLGETEEERKKRLQALQNSQSNIAASVGQGYGGALSPAGNALFGGQ